MHPRLRSYIKMCHVVVLVTVVVVVGSCSSGCCCCEAARSVSIAFNFAGELS